MEDTIWRQKSRAVWLKDGDHNEKFFHDKPSKRRNTNFIKKLKDGNDYWWREENDYEIILINYIFDIFSISSPNNIPEAYRVVQ